MKLKQISDIKPLEKSKKPCKILNKKSIKIKNKIPALAGSKHG